MANIVQMEGVANSEDRRKVKRGSEVEFHYFSLLLVDGHQILISKAFQEVQIFLQLIILRLQGVSSVFKEFKRAWPVAGIDGV